MQLETLKFDFFQQHVPFLDAKFGFERTLHAQCHVTFWVEGLQMAFFFFYSRAPVRSVTWHLTSRLKIL